MADWNEARFHELKGHFLKQGEIHPEPDLSNNELSHESTLDEGHELPESLKQILKIGAKWNFTIDSCDVFNCNIYLVAPSKTVDIFGDEECKQEWLDEHGENSCAGKDWALLCATSEYDYFFVNIRKDSEHFGATRHIVNNCNEEEPFTAAPFENFLNVVEAYAKSNASKLKTNEDDEDEEIEYEDFLEFRNVDN